MRKSAGSDTPQAKRKTAGTFVQKPRVSPALARTCADSSTCRAASAAPRSSSATPLAILRAAPSTPRPLRSLRRNYLLSKADCSNSSAAFLVLSVQSQRACSPTYRRQSQQLFSQPRRRHHRQHMHTVIRRLLILLQRHQCLHRWRLCISHGQHAVVKTQVLSYPKRRQGNGSENTNHPWGRKRVNLDRIGLNTAANLSCRLGPAEPAASAAAPLE